jgi:hypothetical protein
MLLTCYVAHLGPIDRAGPLVVGIGGAEGDAPHGTSSLYHH